jgi:hypothetical protein
MARYFSGDLRAQNPPLRILPPAIKVPKPEDAFQIRNPAKKII